MQEHIRGIRATMAGLAAIALTACSGGGGGSEAQFGQISLGVTDAAVDNASHVVVEFTGVEIKRSDDTPPEVFDFDTPRQIDLLALEGGASELLLQDELLPAGEYEWIRLKVNAQPTTSDSYIELEDGTQYPLFIPSGSESGLKLIRGFVVGAGSLTDFTIDFDLRRSVIAPPGLADSYLLKPVLRIVDNLEVGTLQGEVAATIATESCSPVVYVYEGAGVVPDDIGSPSEPLVTGRVQANDAGALTYRIGFVPAGSYTVALTCEAAADTVEADEEIAFLSPQDVTVVAAETATVDFMQ